MVNLALTGPPWEVGTDGWSLPQSSSPTATLSFMAEDHLRKRVWGGGGVAEPKTDTNGRAHRRTLPTQARMQIPSPSWKRLCGHYLWTKVLEAGGLCITALSVSTTCSASAGRVAELSFCCVYRSQWEHNGPHRPGSGMAFFLSRPHITSPLHLRHLQDPGALNKEVASSARRRRRGEI